MTVQFIYRRTTTCVHGHARDSSATYKGHHGDNIETVSLLPFGWPPAAMFKPKGLMYLRGTSDAIAFSKAVIIELE